MTGSMFIKDILDLVGGETQEPPRTVQSQLGDVLVPR